MKWFKGNTHTHTTESDGDAEPAAVVRWYRRHEYDFLVLTDHNLLTVFEYGPGKRRFRKPLMIPGEEISVLMREGGVPIHINGINISRVIEPIDAGKVTPTIQANVDTILRAGGIACIAHPNFKWAFDHEAIAQVTGARLMEVFNGHPAVNVYGAPGKLSYEQIWDRVLSAGSVIFGVASDDSHRYHDFHPTLGNPGRGWVMVRAPQLTREAIVESLASGEFYASTGVELSEMETSRQSVRLRIEPVADNIYTTTFTGHGGVALAEEVGLEASYNVRGDEGYVRATVRSSSGAKAWTQPVFMR